MKGITNRIVINPEFILRLWTGALPCECDFCGNMAQEPVGVNCSWTVVYYCPDCFELEWWVKAERHKTAILGMEADDGDSRGCEHDS